MIKTYPFDFPEDEPGVYITRNGSVSVEYELHNHRFAELVLIRSGSGLHVTEEGEYPISTGDLLLVLPGQAHAYRDRREMSIWNLVFLPERLPFQMEFLRREPGFRAFFETAPKLRDSFRFRYKLTLDAQNVWQMEKYFSAIEETEKKRFPGWQLEAVAAFLNLLASIIRAAESPENHNYRNLMRIDCICGEISRNSSVSLAEIARKNALSIRSMERLFEASLQCSPQEYLQEIRLRRAMKLLEDSERKVTDIAQECGFCDGNYFAKVFRKKYGASPREYRRKFRPDSQK